jgi:hypothetical protein
MALLAKFAPLGIIRATDYRNDRNTSPFDMRVNYL